MKVSEAWLREWVNPNIATTELVEQLTMAGLEVDAVAPVAGAFSGVVVGEIMRVEPHPDADKLRVCQVAGGEQALTQVVCGAPNARIGIKIPFALVGAKLPGDFKIKKAKLRGVESFGMLCGQTELEVGDDDSGLWELALDAPVGKDLREYLQLNDQVIEVDLTPNRSDCLGVSGLAREVGVLNKIEVTAPAIPEVAATVNDQVAVALDATNACPKYVGRIVKGVDITKPSPLWMQEKLRRAGVRPIDAVVDVTNYVLQELGQPMHAFDLAKISGDMQVRMAHLEENLTLLDGQEIKLNDDTLVIADGSGAIAMAGIMGGATTAVTDKTCDILLEAAFFQPVAIAGRARAYGLHTDASHRFERGVDYAATRTAMERATALLLDIVGGQAGPIVEQVAAEAMPADRTVELARERIQRSLGFAIPDTEVVDILTRLGLQKRCETPAGWTFLIPSYRFDISIEADLLEELARIYGYNRLPACKLKIPASLPPKSESHVAGGAVLRHLLARDYQEVITYSFVDPKLQAHFAEGQQAVELLNPISADMAVMRTSLIPGLIQALKHNVNRQQNRVRLFERGLRFIPAVSGEVSAMTQTMGFAGLIYGSRTADSWQADTSWVDFYDIKGDLEALLALGRQNIEFQVCDAIGYMHPGQCAKVLINGHDAGYVGALHPQTQKALELKKSVFVFELNWQLLTQASVPKFSPISKFPEVARDLAFVVDKQIGVQSLMAVLKQAAGGYLKELKVFDVYSGEGIDISKKSIAFNLTFQDSSRTLNEEEINESIDSVIRRLEEEFDAKLR